MFDIMMAEAKTLRAIVSAVADLVDEATFRISPEGVDMKAMDPARVAMVILELPDIIFTEYNVDQEHVIGVDMAKLQKIMKRARAGDSARLRLDEKRNLLEVAFIGKTTRRFQLPLIEVSSEYQQLRVPQLEFLASVEIRPRAIAEAVDDCKSVADHVTMEAKEDAFIMRASGDLGRVEIEIKEGDEALIRYEYKDYAKGTYSVEYLDNMTKVATAADSVVIHLGKDLPLQMDFPILDRGMVRFLLAPRIEAE